MKDQCNEVRQLCSHVSARNTHREAPRIQQAAGGGFDTPVARLSQQRQR